MFQYSLLLYGVPQIVSISWVNVKKRNRCRIPFLALMSFKNSFWGVRGRVVVFAHVLNSPYSSALVIFCLLWFSKIFQLSLNYGVWLLLNLAQNKPTKIHVSLQCSLIYSHGRNKNDTTSLVYSHISLINRLGNIEFISI